MQSHPYQQPPRFRVIAAFLIAPLASAFAFAIWQPVYLVLPTITRVLRSWCVYTIFGGYPTALVFGVPSYFLLRRRLKPTWVACTLAGGVVVEVPWLVLTVLPSPATEAWGDKHQTVVNHVRTVWGWIEGARAVGEIGVVGLIGGLCFWLVAVTGWRQTAEMSA